MDGMISVADIASYFNMSDKGGIHRQIKKLGIEYFLLRDNKRGGQECSYITLGDFERIKAIREPLTPAGIVNAKDALNEAPNEGVFYLLDIWPDKGLYAYKGGYSARTGNDRYREHRTMAPLFKEVKHWVCEQYHERPALDLMFNTKGAEQIGREVVITSDIAAVVERLDVYFKLVTN